ncbi:MAG: D-glycero-beta-D-manno-heptose 1-phosphate adenylyltransferase [Candidatus Cloacimonetes bacterium 4572_55]|nr:MAG: D-glycero-beta-D-manno-heptose 1-phosphate adenylyltransferase [Candidatus Cloacimonetes bacterium 4572_55]
MGKIIENRDELKQICAQLKQKKLRIVFTNGVFDLVHRGHIDYLQKAKRLGDVLVLGLNTDRSVKQIKGDKRPLIAQMDRAVLLSALECVDYVTFFDEPTPLTLIEQVAPGVLVKGGDWSIDKIVGREVVEKNGGIVRSIPFLEGYSSTNLIRRIISIYG